MPTIQQQLDLMGALFSLATTYYLIRVNSIAWPLGIIATTLNATLYYISGLYADMGLETYYWLSGFYGWYLWQQQATKPRSMAPRHIHPRECFWLGLIAVSAITGLTVLLKYRLHSQVALLDASTTVLSLIAQWLLCKKIIENWLLWIIVDSSYFFLYATKTLNYHSILMVIYTVMALVAYLQWRSYPGFSPQASLDEPNVVIPREWYQ